jgi:NACalpha-BTF3-like transcription factor
MDINELKRRRDERYKAAIAKLEARPEHQQIIAACKASEETGAACLACNTARQAEEQAWKEFRALSMRSAVDIELVIARATAAERTAQSAIAERDALAATVNRLLGALAIARPMMNRIQHFTPYENELAAEKLVDDALAATPAQNLAAVKAAALRGLEPLMEICGDNCDEVVYWSEIQKVADRLERTAKGEQASGPGEGSR